MAEACGEAANHTGMCGRNQGEPIMITKLAKGIGTVIFTGAALIALLDVFDRASTSKAKR